MGKQPNSHSKRKLSQDTCLELTRADLLEHITKEMGGRVSGDNITEIICPGCEVMIRLLEELEAGFTTRLGNESARISIARSKNKVRWAA